MARNMFYVSRSLKVTLTYDLTGQTNQKNEEHKKDVGEEINGTQHSIRLLNEVVLKVAKNHPNHGQNRGDEVTEVWVLGAK